MFVTFFVCVLFTGAAVTWRVLALLVWFSFLVFRLPIPAANERMTSAHSLVALVRFRYAAGCCRRLPRIRFSISVVENCVCKR